MLGSKHITYSFYITTPAQDRLASSLVAQYHAAVYNFAYFNFFFSLYIAGLYPKVENLYPTVQFPVPADTPLLSSTLGWMHDEVW